MKNNINAISLIILSASLFVTGCSSLQKKEQPTKYVPVYQEIIYRKQELPKPLVTDIEVKVYDKENICELVKKLDTNSVCSTQTDSNTQNKIFVLDEKNLKNYLNNYTNMTETILLYKNIISYYEDLLETYNNKVREINSKGEGK